MNTQCSICLSSLDEKNETSSSKCGHVFHYNCIVDWIQRSKTCPECRTSLTRRSIFKLYLFSAERPPGTEDSLGLEIEPLKESIREFVRKNEDLKSKIGFLELQLEEKTKAQDFLRQRFDNLEKTRQWELSQLNCQFVNYTNQSDQIKQTLKCQIENLQKEKSTIQTKVKDIEFELGKRTESYVDLLQKYHTLVKANEDELRRKERQFANYKIQYEKNVDQLKSEIGKLQREARSFRTKIGDLEWELDKKTKTNNDLLQEFSKIEKKYQLELNEKDREFSFYQTRSERYIKSMKSKIGNLRRQNKAFRKIVKDINYRKKKGVICDSQPEITQLINSKAVSEDEMKFLQNENSSLKREVKFLRLM